MNTSPKTGAELLLEVAQGLFLTRGYANVSMQTIAAEAGMTKGAPYYHFASKQELFYQVSVRLFAELQQAATQALESDGSLEERLRNAFVMLASTVSGDFSSWVNDVHREMSPEMHVRFKQSFGGDGELAELVRPAFERARERGEFASASPTVAARVFIRLALACVDEASYMRLTDRYTVEWVEQIAAESASVLVNGI